MTGVIDDFMPQIKCLKQEFWLKNPNWNDSFLELTFFLLLGIEGFFFLIILLPFFLSEEVYIRSDRMLPQLERLLPI